MSGAQMTIKALAPWFGGKRTLAPRIVAELGEHAAYWEVFCGSMAVLLAKEPATMETVNDLNGDLVNLARVIKHDVLGPKLYRRMRRELCTAPTFDDAAMIVREHANTPAGQEPDLDRASAYFVASWWGRNGVTGTASYNQGFSRRFTKNGGNAATRVDSAVQSIPEWRRRMRGVTVLSECGISLCERIEDASGVSIYADPPYVEKGAAYIHDFDAEHHVRLRDALARFTRTRVVVSYYDHPTVRELYAGWTFVDCAMTKSLVSAGMRDAKGATVAPEVLIINGPSFTESEADNHLFGSAHSADSAVKSGGSSA